MNLLNGTFHFTVTVNGETSNLCYSNFYSQDLTRLISYFNFLIESEASVIKYLFLFETHKNEPADIGNNDFSILIDQDKIKFDILFDHSNIFSEGFLPYVTDKNSIISFLKEANKSYFMLNEGKIKCLIPESKLDSWTFVPNEYITDEWWELQKQKKVGVRLRHHSLLSLEVNKSEVYTLNPYSGYRSRTNKQ